VILWTRVLTSGRRARTMSGLSMLGVIVSVAIAPSRMLQRRSNVERIWYDSNRENDDASSSDWGTRVANLAALAIMIVVVTGPLWMIPLPSSLRDGPLGTAKYTIQIFLCHVGLIAIPCLYFLVRSLLHQKRWPERIKRLLLIAACGWASWANTFEVGRFWLDWL
jgi:hypothetical protein